MQSPISGAVIYARLSPRDGDAEADLQRMVSELKAFAERLGVPVVDVIAEGDISAWIGSGERKGRWGEVIAGLSSGKWDGLIVRSLDRCARDMIETIKLAQLREQTGFAFYALNGDTIGDELFTAIAGWKNARESRDKSDRLKLKWADKASRGDYHPGRYRPFGYQYVRDAAGTIRGLAIDPTEAGVVREIAQRVTAGESCHMIAIELEQRGVPTVSGANWQRNMVKRILKPLVAGLLTHNDEELPGNHQAIIDMETYHAATAAMKQGEAPKGHNARKHLLSGFLVCGLCGVKLTCNGRVYQCTTKNTASGVRGCGRIARTQGWLDGLITDLVVARLEQLDLEVEQVVADDWSPVVEAAQDEVALIQTAYEAKEISVTEWLQGLKVARGKLSQAEEGRQKSLTAATCKACKRLKMAGTVSTCPKSEQ
jgi:site-specific DNA recombinase